MSGYESETRVPNSCTVNTTIDWTYTLNGEEIGRIQKTYSNVSHQTVASFQMLGDTCEDGYYVTESCKYCNYSETYDNLRYNHGWYTVDRYDLTDYGMCGGELWLESCACGLVSSMGWNGWNCNASNVGVDAETGLPIRKCSDCGLSFVRGEVGNVNTNCRYTGTAYFKIFDANDDLILDLEHAVSNESHEDKVLNLILDNPDGTCNEGWTAEFACVNCGRTDEERGYYHRTWTLDYLDLSEYNTCGGYVSTYGCACGQDEYYNWDLECNLRHIDGGYATDADGKEYYYDNYKCALCGLQRNDVRYEEYEGDSCYGISTRRNTFILGTELNKTIERVNETERHEYEYTYSLLPGSVTCEDGIQVNAICKKCGYVTGHTSDYHGENLVESMDLTEFGSICGGALNHYSCPCGAEQRYDISEDTECDVYRNGIAHWIPNVLDTYQHTTEGYMGTWSYSYLLNCAVTDPEQCGLRIRMAEYWLKEGCEAVEYQTWQLGYDDQTDTCKREITIPTGERHAFHAYIRTNYNDVVQADGTVMWGWRDDCPDCGSYYEDLYYDNQNGARILNVENAVNTLNNGENRERHMRYEFGFEYSGHRYMTLERYEYIRSDGSTYWNQHAYAYDFSDGCRCTRTYTNSQGNYEVYQQDAHVGGWHGEWLQDRSCTQFGLYHEWEECSVCGATFDEYYEDYVPYDHDWYWDYSKETYVCDRCDLENSNAASGSIIMEDLTGIHNGDQYVIGYWNRGQVEFIPNISIVLEDATGDDDLLTLSYSDFWYWNAETDVATAVACDKAAVDAAVEAALIDAGYTGNYAIRISFVPINGDDTLDYAITFDSQYFANALAA